VHIKVFFRRELVVSIAARPPVRALRASAVLVGIYLGLLASNGSAQFATIINVPPTTLTQSLSVGAGIQVNVLPGGVVDVSMDVADGGEVNVLGGVDTNLITTSGDGRLNVGGGSAEVALAADGGVINLSGGVIDDVRIFSGGVFNMTGGAIARAAPNFSGQINLNLGAVANLSGGTFSGIFNAPSNSSLTVTGGEFRLDGAPISGLDSVGSTQQLSIAEGSILTGTLADGTPFSFSTRDSAHIGLVRLTVAALPAAPSVISVPNLPAPRGVRDGQTLIVSSGGAVGSHFRAGWGSSVNLNAGGVIGSDFAVLDGSHVSIAGGSVGQYFAAKSGSVVSISGGAVDRNVSVSDGATISISGGSIGDELVAGFGSHVSVSGGVIGDHMTANGVLTVSGGSIGRGLQTTNMATLVGGDFRLNDVPVAGLNTIGDSALLHPAPGAMLTGTYADGTPFVFIDAFSGGVTLKLANLPPITPAIINVPGSLTPLGVRLGQTVVVSSGGTLGPNFQVGRGGALNVHGGAVGANLNIVRGTVEITSGSIGQTADARGSYVTVAGGAVGANFLAHAGTTVDITAGAVGSGFYAGAGSVVNIAGGSIGSGFTADTGSTLNISGGSINSLQLNSGSVTNISGGFFGRVAYQDFVAANGSTTNLFGRQFMLNGQPIAGLKPGTKVAVTSKQGTLTGLFANGSPFNFTLFTPGPRGGAPKGFYSSSVLTLTLVPEPCSLAMAASMFIVVPLQRSRCGRGRSAKALAMC
jgi:hypothetical protein